MHSDLTFLSYII